MSSMQHEGSETMLAVTDNAQPKREKMRYVKCLVWDLDHTLWDGVLLEDEKVTLRPNVSEVIRELDNRGVLQSIASKNDRQRALDQLREFGLQNYFLYPQINWNSKVASLKAIAATLNIGLDALAFIDDQPFEREEISFSLPEVLCLSASELDQLLHRPELNPPYLTEDSRARRQMYLSDQARKAAEEEFVGPQEEFLASLEMKLKLTRCGEADLKRAEELTVRTNQLNTTGVTYSYEELDHFRQSPAHQLWIASLEDKFGSYGKIGLALVECEPDAWNIKLLLMSCRVMHRGVGTILLNHIINQAAESGVRLRADFIPNNVNRMMYVTYKFAGFKEVEKIGPVTVLENSRPEHRPTPGYVQVHIQD